MKRRNKVNELTQFKVMKVQKNLALAEYPQLASASEIDLNLIANQLLQLDNNTVLNVNIFVNSKPIQIVNLGLAAPGSEQKKEAPSQQQTPQATETQTEEPPAEDPPTPDEPQPDAQAEEKKKQDEGLQEHLSELGRVLENLDKQLNELREASERNH